MTWPIKSTRIVTGEKIKIVTNQIRTYNCNILQSDPLYLYPYFQKKISYDVVIEMNERRNH